MAVNYSATLKTNRMQLVADLVASKSAAASTGSATAGTLVIGTTGMASTLVTFTLDATPGTVSGSVLTFTNSGTAISSGNPKTAVASATGTAAAAQIKNNAGTVIVDGLTVGTSATDITINTTSISSGQTVNLTGATITHG